MTAVNACGSYVFPINAQVVDCSPRWECIFQELLGLVVDFTWEQRGGCTAAVLTAAAPLARGTLLCQALWLEGLPWERLLAQWGLAHLDGTGQRLCSGHTSLGPPAHCMMSCRSIGSIFRDLYKEQCLQVLTGMRATVGGGVTPAAHMRCAWTPPMSTRVQISAGRCSLPALLAAPTGSPVALPRSAQC